VPRIDKIDSSLVGELQSALDCGRYTSGTTHNFYHYPARFSPRVANNIVKSFTRRGDWILDPFMGGGTGAIEALITGRRFVGTDINSLAHFVSGVRTRPISAEDEDAIRGWARQSAKRGVGYIMSSSLVPSIRNLPPAFTAFMTEAKSLAKHMPPRRRNFAQCVLLRLGQWALDCRDFSAPRRSRLAERLPVLAEEMILGLQDFVSQCRAIGLQKRALTDRRLLLNRSAVGIEADAGLRSLRRKPRLVFTSPPYPAVNVLYHRWQYRGRKETPAPYWIADVKDGCGQAYYCGGSRTPTGLRNYFSMITDAYSSVRAFVHPDAYIVQLMGFSNAEEQLPIYLRCLESAGLEECKIPRRLGGPRLARRVPNRKWYAKLQGEVDASTEYLLIHRVAA